MALSIDRLTNIIFIPRADMTLVQSSPTEIRELDIDAFRLELKDIEDDPFGIGYTDTHRHVQPITVGGVTLARVIEILSPYSITFEDGQYQVNIVGGNSNVSDVTNLNQVGLRSSNSVGLQIVNTGSGLTAAQDAALSSSRDFAAEAARNTQP